MFKKILITLLLFSNSSFASEPWNSSEGLDRLSKSQFKSDFYQLVNFYQPQINPIYCAVASSVTVLNALNLGNIYKQEEFLNEKTDLIKLKTIINHEAKNTDGNYDAGVSIGDLAKILSQSYSLKIELIYAENFDERSINNFRKILKEVLSENKKFIIANFNGKILKHKTGGHISPIAAYDKSSDSLLVLDVALHKNQWFWVDLTEFYQAMNSKDGANHRGFVIAAKK